MLKARDEILCQVKCGNPCNELNVEIKYINVHTDQGELACKSTKA